MTRKLTCFLLLFSISVCAEIPLVTETQKKMEEQDKEYQKILGSLYSSNQKIRKVVVEKSKLEQEKHFIEAQLKLLSEQILNQERDQKEKRRQLLSKIQFLHRFHSQAWVNFILKSKNSAELDRNLKVLAILSKNDAATVKAYSASVKALANQRTKFKTRLSALESLGKEIVSKEQDLKGQSQQRYALLEKIRKGQTALLDKIRKLKKSQKSVEISESGILDAIDGKGFLERKGELAMPVSARVKRFYGIYRDPNDRMVFNRKGWYFEAPFGTSVRPVAPGEVSFQGKIPELGNVIVLDHGDHFFSVYAGLAMSHLDIGIKVNENEILGYSGYLGLEDGPGIYLELRHFSEPIDPKSWMKGQGYEITDNS